MSGFRANSIVNRDGTGAPNFPNGIVATGATFTQVSSVNATFSGNLTIGGTVSYQEVENIDAVGVVTAQQGIQVEANGLTVTGVGTFNNSIEVVGVTTADANGLNVAGVITATTLKGSGANLTGILPTLSGIASGALTDGAPVIIQSDGTFKTVTQSTVSNSPTITNGGNWTNVENSYNTVSHQPGTSKYMVFYRDGNDNDYGKCVVGTLNGDKTSFSFGSIVTFESARVEIYGAVYVPNIGKHVVIYSDQGNSRYLTYGIVYMNGTTPRVDATGVIDSSRTDQADICLFGISKIVIAYQGGGGGTLRAIVGDPSSSSITFGSAVAWGGSGGTEQYAGISTTSDSNKVVVSGRDTIGIARVGTISGTSISFGSKITLNSDGGTDYATQWNTITYDSSTQKNLFTFRDGSTGYLASRVGTVSGTSISFGTKQVHTSQGARNCDSVYQSSNQKTLVAYRNDTTNNLNISEMEISGTNVSAANTVALGLTFTSAGDYHISYDSTIDRSIIGAQKSSLPTYGFLGIVTPGSTSTTTNLTANNFLGFSNAAYTDGQTATIQITGSVDDAQSGLTTARKHYVQNDGTLGITTDDPLVEAGVAISATEIIVKG